MAATGASLGTQVAVREDWKVVAEGMAQARALEGLWLAYLRH